MTCPKHPQWLLRNGDCCPTCQLQTTELLSLREGRAFVAAIRLLGNNRWHETALRNLWKVKGIHAVLQFAAGWQEERR